MTAEDQLDRPVSEGPGRSDPRADRGTANGRPGQGRTPPGRVAPGPGRWLLIATTSTLLWLASNAVGTVTAHDARGVAAVYVPVALVVIALVRRPDWRAPVLVGVVLGATVLCAGSGGMPIVGAGEGAANAVEALLVAVLIARWSASDLRSPRDVLALASACVLGAGVGAWLGAASEALFRDESPADPSWAHAWLGWFAADLLGLVLLVPLGLTADRQSRSWPRIGSYAAILAASSALALLAIGLIWRYQVFVTSLAWYALLLLALVSGIRWGLVGLGVAQFPAAIAAFAVLGDATDDEWLARQALAIVLALSLTWVVVAVRSELRRRDGSEQLLRDMFARSPVPTARVSVPGPASGGSAAWRTRVLEVNQAWGGLLGEGPGAVVGSDLMQRVAIADLPVAARFLGRPEVQGTPCEVRLVRPGQPGMVVRLAAVTMQDAELRPPRAQGPGRELILVAEDVTAQREAEAVLRHQAETDALTGVLNRRAIIDELARLLDVLSAGSGLACVLFIDLDAFKQVNDSHGHAVGDQVLRDVARRLVGALRPTDRVGRYGGDEFLAIAPVAHPTEAEALAERVTDTLSEPAVVAGSVVGAGCSVGMAVATPGQTLEDVLHLADEQMYRRKAARLTGSAED